MQLQKDDLVINIDKYQSAKMGVVRYTFTPLLYTHKNSIFMISPNDLGLRYQQIQWASYRGLDCNLQDWIYCTSENSFSVTAIQDLATEMGKISKKIEKLNLQHDGKATLGIALTHYATWVRAKAFVIKDTDQNNNQYWRTIEIREINAWITVVISDANNFLRSLK